MLPSCANQIETKARKVKRQDKQVKMSSGQQKSKRKAEELAEPKPVVVIVEEETAGKGKGTATQEQPMEVEEERVLETDIEGFDMWTLGVREVEGQGWSIQEEQRFRGFKLNTTHEDQGGRKSGYMGLRIGAQEEEMKDRYTASHLVGCIFEGEPVT